MWILQLREYIDDTEDYINIQVANFEIESLQLIDHIFKPVRFFFFFHFFFEIQLNIKYPFLQLDNHRNQLIQVL